MPDIVVGVDGSEDSERALRWAVAEGQARDVCVRAVLVWASAGPPHSESRPPPPTSPEHPRWVAERMLERVVEKVRADMPVARIDERAMFGPPVSTLLAAAADAEMLVLGAKGMTSGRRTLAGSVSLACTHRATVPVVVVHPSPSGNGADVDRPGPPPEIVVGIDGSSASIDALRWAVAEATQRRAPLRIVHVSPAQASPSPAQASGSPTRASGSPARADDVPAGRSAESPATAAVLNLTAVRAEIDGRPTLETTSDVRFGHVADQLIQAAASAQLLVVGARGGGGFDGLLLGSISSQCVMYAPCPVAVIR
jgi:nucleotide-binding universal stress UspA family protein